MQFVVGNIVLPRLAGSSLNISLFVTILSLFVFGALWGVTGMFVAMPLTAILVIVMQNFEATRPIAILLSRTGELERRAADDPWNASARRLEHFRINLARSPSL